MIELTNEEFDYFVSRIISLKKETNKEWNVISQNMEWFIDELLNFKKEDLNSFNFYKPKIIKAAKEKIIKESNTKGATTADENWFYLDHIKGSKVYWDNFERQMIESSHWSKERFETITKQSCEITNSLADPKKNDTSTVDAIRKGLVYGNVQSGKTAHIAALISMYASAGCKMFIVLSGVTNNLRKQTQERLNHDLSVELPNSKFLLLTNEDDKLSNATQPIEALYSSENAIIGVYKKIPSPLKRLLKYLKKLNDSNFWYKKQVLIIDDECDQYSPNISDMFTDSDYEDEETHEKFKRSTVNGLIVKLLNTFERYNYVGFTATPFATILNEPPSLNSIYPENFIYPLSKNAKYYGADKIFGAINEDPEEENLILNAIRTFDPKEIFVNRQTVSDKVPQSLETAIIYFIIATACKYYRGLKDHSSMLIHLDLKISIHAQLQKMITRYKNELLHSYKDLESKFEKTWNDEKNKISFDTVKKLFSYNDEESYKYKIPEYSELKIYINEVLNKIEIIVDNSSQPLDKRLHYSTNHENGDVKIIIGGNTLSRGLTLEGLLVSYFYRTSKNYDTLLQMGRWFGYRIGYEDLARIWTTERLKFQFSELADVEEELRNQFDQYKLGLSPSELAVKIRKLPLLQITRKMAMQSAISTGINYSGDKPQTLFFKNNREWLLHNIQLTSNFLSTKNYAYKHGEFFIFENVTVSEIIDFTQNFNIDPRNRRCNKELILKYLKKAKDNHFIENWNIAIASNKTGEDFPISPFLNVKLIERSQLDLHEDTNTFYLKTMSQPQNLIIDTDSWDKITSFKLQDLMKTRKEYFDKLNEPQRGLLVIYPIKKDGKGKNSNNPDRKPLAACENVIGLMFVFPFERTVNLDEYMTIELSERIDDYDE